MTILEIDVVYGMAIGITMLILFCMWMTFEHNKQFDEKKKIEKDFKNYIETINNNLDKTIEQNYIDIINIIDKIKLYPNYKIQYARNRQDL